MRSCWKCKGKGVVQAGERACHLDICPVCAAHARALWDAREAQRKRLAGIQQADRDTAANAA